MYSINDLKKEVLIEVDGVPYRVVDSQHVSLGRGGAVMRTKIKNMLTGAVTERTWRPAEKIAPAHIERLKMQYLYREGDDFYFMNTETYDQAVVQVGVLGSAAVYLAEGSTVPLLEFEGKVIGMELANSVYLKVTHTEPGLKGDTATAALKEATLETGATTQVPLFINEGDVIKVDTRSGAYLERQK